MADICSADKSEVVRRLDNMIKNIEAGYSNFPKRDWPDCPAEHGPPMRTVAHPYLKGVCFKENPISKPQAVKVTVDGRLGAFKRDKLYNYSEPPLNIPPWYRPRYKSVEVRGGTVMNGCDCWKKNGLQDDCQRWDCQRPECMTQPFPECPPGSNPPFNGIRKPNAYMM